MAVECRGLCFSYNGPEVIRNVNFTLARGEFAAVIGPNGSGKTTLLRLLLGELRPLSGRVGIFGLDVRSVTRRRLAKIAAFVPQERGMIFDFTAREVVMMGRNPHLGLLQFEGERDHEIVTDAMSVTNTLKLAERQMSKLSGGERQRVMIARALAQEPSLLLLDEATAHLDLKHRLEIMDIISGLNEDKNMTVLMVTQDINMASSYCRRILMIKEGAIYKDGPPEDVLTTDNIRAVYGARVLVDIHPLTGRPRISPYTTRMLPAAENGDVRIERR